MKNSSEKHSFHLVYKAWELADADVYDCWGMGSELLLYDEELHNSCEDDLKALTEIVLSIQEEMDKRGIKYEKTVTEPHEPQHVQRPI